MNFLTCASLFILAQVERLHFLKYKLHSDTGRERFEVPFRGSLESRQDKAAT